MLIIFTEDGPLCKLCIRKQIIVLGNKANDNCVDEKQAIIIVETKMGIEDFTELSRGQKKAGCVLSVTACKGSLRS